MLDDPRVAFEKLLVPRNILSRLDKLEMMSLDPSQNVDSLGEITSQTGDLIVDNLIAIDPDSESYEPTDSTFIGTFISGEGKTFNSEVFNAGGASAGTLQWGGRQSDGKFIAGAGDVTLDADGIAIVAPATLANQNLIRWLKSGSIVFEMGALHGDVGTATSSTVQLISRARSGTGGNEDSRVYIGVYNDAGAYKGAIDLNNLNGTVQLNLQANRTEITDGFFGFGAQTELTIAAGVVTATRSYHSIDTQADAATDDLDTINGGSEGDILIILANNTARTVVCKDGTGNLNLAGDFTMDSAQDRLTLVKSAAGNWVEIARADNGA